MRADHEKVSRLLRTARGQIDGILRMIEEDVYCMDVSNQVLAAQSVLRRANKEIIQSHLEGCVLDAMEHGTADEKMKEIMALIEKLSR